MFLGPSLLSLWRNDREKQGSLFALRSSKNDTKELERGREMEEEGKEGEGNTREKENGKTALRRVKLKWICDKWLLTTCTQATGRRDATGSHGKRGRKPDRARGCPGDSPLPRARRLPDAEVRRANLTIKLTRLVRTPTIMVNRSNSILAFSSRRCSYRN